MILLSKLELRMTVVRRIARIMGLLIVGLFLMFMVGEGFIPLKLNGTEIAQHAVLLVALTGMLVLWRWELLGGVMVIAGMIAFYSINIAASGRLPGGPVFPLCFVPGILALVCWWKGRNRKSSSEP
jgi:hypothetical protein